MAIFVNVYFLNALGKHIKPLLFQNDAPITNLMNTTIFLYQHNKIHAGEQMLSVEEPCPMTKSRDKNGRGHERIQMHVVRIASGRLRQAPTTWMYLHKLGEFGREIGKFEIGICTSNVK